MPIRRILWSNALMLPAGGILQLFTQILIIRGLSLTTFGVWATLFAFKETVLTYTDFGLSATITRFLIDTEERSGREGVRTFLQKMVALKVGIGLAVLGLGYIGSGLLVRRLGLAPAGPVALVMLGAVYFCEQVSLVFDRFLEATFMQECLNKIRFGSAALILLVVVFLVARGPLNLEYLCALYAATSVGLILVEYRLVVNRLGEMPIRAPEPGRADGLVRRILKCCTTVYIDKVINSFTSPAFLIVLLSLFFRKEEIAYFALATDLAMKGVAFWLIPINGFILPLFSRAHASGQTQRLQSAFKTAMRFLSTSFSFMAGVVPITSAAFIEIVYTPRFLPATALMQLYVPCILLKYSVVSGVTALALTAEHYRAFLTGRAILVVAVFALMPIVPIMKLSMVAAVFFLGLVDLVCWLWMADRVSKSVGLNCPFGHGARAVLVASASAVLGLLSSKLFGDPLAALIGVSIVYIAAFAILTRLAGLITPEDRAVLLRFQIAPQWSVNMLARSDAA